MQGTVLPLSDDYRGAVYVALLQQVPCALLCSLMLDGGRLARVCGIAVLGFWVAAALIMARRPTAPGRWDRPFLRWGFLPVLATTIALSRFA
ncbi:hypothetical protein OJF2_78080 [Aquisphaera giovannonii]|uniref:Uncharacterized protein n=1 Tax=Aquisphaera giovannonii TaxID=406548 RepID=A0A5B9WEX0_9BACT|nr:hypothetical protein [Aquisphaera giovannonii]QEH39196.1 hypothetical protein OJF2_78080 [Aquisphaera giovannonii]